MFNIGDIVYTPDYGSHAEQITCPECLGTKVVKVVYPDGVEVAVDCQYCNTGDYREPLGYIFKYSMSARAKQHFVKAVTQGIVNDIPCVQYTLEPYAQTGIVYETEEYALAIAEQNRLAKESEANSRILAKHSRNQSYAWNASYWRRQIEDYEARIIDAKRRLHLCEGK